LNTATLLFSRYSEDACSHPVWRAHLPCRYGSCRGCFPKNGNSLNNLVTLQQSSFKLLLVIRQRSNNSATRLRGRQNASFLWKHRLGHAEGTTDSAPRRDKTFPAEAAPTSPFTSRL